MMVRRDIWRALLTLLALLALAGGFFPAGTAAAAPGPSVTVSTGVGPNTRPALAISPDNTKLCVVWNTFDKSPDAYARIYDFTTQSWSAIVNLSQNPGANTLAVRCAIDVRGTTHVTWSEGGENKAIQYRRLEKGRDAGAIGNWSGITTVSREFDAQWADSFAMSTDPSGTIWVAYAAKDGKYNVFVRSVDAAGGVNAATKVSESDGHHPRIGVDSKGYVQVIYRGGGAAQYTYRDIATNQWSTPVALPGSGGAVEQLGLAVDRDSGAVHAVYAAGGDDSRTVRYVSKAGPTGTSFSGPVALTGAGRYVVPRLAWSPTGRLIMVSDLRQGAGSIVYNISDDNGATWNGADSLPDATTQGWPWVVADKDGGAYVAYWNTNGHTIRVASIGGATLTAPGSSTPPPAPGPTPAPAPAPRPGCGAYSCWASEDGILTDSPGAASFRGRAYVFARGTDDALYVKSTVDGREYSEWRSLGGILTAAPAAASNDGRLYVFAKGTDDALYVKSSPDGYNFTDWESLGGILTAPPAAASASGILYVFARGTDNALYTMTADSGTDFGRWKGLGGILEAAPAAAGFRGRIYVYGMGTDAALYVKRSFSGTNFDEWDRLGGTLTAAPAAASTTDALHVYVNGSDSALYEKVSTDGNGYSEWAGLGGDLSPGSTPAAAGAGDRIFVFVRAADDSLYERHRTE